MADTDTTLAIGEMAVSERGLRLIKAFEGYRPVDRVLVTGTRVAGYGHRVVDEGPLAVSREEAHALLLRDLAPFEDMVNENVFSSVTQGQFDALVSLAFNIGPRAFLESDVLKAVNAGRPLDAANAFDQWRKAEVAGQAYVIDALVRRRTAEKALFLRPAEGASQPRAPGSDLEPERDGAVLGELDGPTLGRTEAGKLVGDAPYELSRLITDLPERGRRRDDGPLGELAESVTVVRPESSGLVDLELTEELADDETVFAELDEVIAPDAEGVANDALPASPIAEAAEEIRGRLDALIDAPETEVEAVDVEFPESLIRPVGDEVETGELPADDLFADPDARVIAFPARTEAPTPVAEPQSAPTVVIDTLEQDEAVRSRDMPALREGDWNGTVGTPERRDETGWPFVALITVGGALFGAGAMAWRRGVDTVAGLDGPLVSLAAVMVGGLILLAGLLYLLKTLLEGDEL